MDILKMKKGAGQISPNTCRFPMSDSERERCIAQGDYPRMSDITWRIFRIMAEFVEGFEFLSTLKQEVTIFGSARLPASNRWYQEAEKLGRLLGENGYTTVTGGGPGIMEAGNKGAYEAKGRSVGLNIMLPTEQRINPYVLESRAFHYFFTRKTMLAASAQAYVYFPGGYGTMDELCEILTLIQTKKSEQIPIVLVSKEFWSPLIEWFKTMMYEKMETISREDLDLFKVVDSAEEAFAIIRASNERKFF